MRRRLAQALFPVARCSLRPGEIAVVFAVSAVVAFFRLGAAGLGGRIWAEDGTIFLQSDLDHGFLASLPQDYAGYLHVAPRLVAAVIEPLPVSWWGPALHVAAALAGAAVATVAYAALRGQLPGRVARSAVALCVVAVPVGTEVVASIANLQWFLLYGALIALFWQPRRTAAWVVVATTVFLTDTSSPFAFVVLVAAFVRWVVGRGRGALAVLAVAAVGFAIQTARMLTAAARTPVPGREPGLDAIPQLRGFASRVLGDAVLGTGRYMEPAEAPSARWGAVVAVVVVALAVLTWHRTRIAGLRFVTVLIGLAFVTYLVPVVASGAPTARPFSVGRYYVAPALFVLTAVVCLCARAAALLAERTTPRAVGAAVAATATISAVAFGLASSYDLASVYARDTGPTWPAAIAAERRACSDRPAGAPVVVQLRPERRVWVLRLTCRQLD